MSSGQGVDTAVMSSQQLKLAAGDGAHQHSTADREGARQTPLLPEDLLAVNCCWGDGERSPSVA